MKEGLRLRTKLFRLEKCPIYRGDGRTWVLRTKLLFHAPHEVAETASKIMNTINISLEDTTVRTLLDFEKLLSFVTECAETIP